MNTNDWNKADEREAQAAQEAVLAAAEWVPLADLIPWKRNPRHNDGRPVRVVADSIRRFGFADPVVAWREKRQIVGGHTRIKAMQAILADAPDFVPRGCPSPGMVPVRFMDFASQAEADACAVALNKAGEAATWDDGALADILHDIEEADASLLDAIGFEDDELAALLGDPGDAGGSGDDRRDGPNLAERFGVPPFSVLDARQGYWQDRKRAWLGIGIQSELGRGAAETGIPGGARLPAATLDPSGKTQRGDGRGRVAGGGQEMIDGRAKGLTWGQSGAMSHPTFNHYRDAEKANRGGRRG